MSKNRSRKVQAVYKDKKSKHVFELSLFQFDENKVVVIYSPALDLSGYGKSEKEAEKSFEEALNEFTRYTTNKGTLLKELRRLGWTFSKKENNAPRLENMLASNEYLADIFEHKEFKKYNSKVHVPISA